jgi:hypothetical protein
MIYYHRCGEAQCGAVSLVTAARAARRSAGPKGLTRIGRPTKAVGNILGGSNDIIIIGIEG